MLNCIKHLHNTKTFHIKTNLTIPPKQFVHCKTFDSLVTGHLMFSQALDGNDVKVLSLQWLRSQIGLVSQEPVLFDTTIADNIRYGANFREVTDSEVETAAKSANIHNFIMGLPEVCV